MDKGQYVNELIFIRLLPDDLLGGPKKEKQQHRDRERERVPDPESLI